MLFSSLNFVDLKDSISKSRIGSGILKAKGSERVGEANQGDSTLSNKEGNVKQTPTSLGNDANPRVRIYGILRLLKEILLVLGAAKNRPISGTLKGSN